MMQVTEPATLITDWLMAGLALWWFLRLGGAAASPARTGWRRAFLWLAVSSFLGGGYHGFQSVLPGPVPEVLWRGTLLGAALASLFVLKAGLLQFGRAGATGWLRFAELKALAVVALGQAWPDFLVVLTDFAASLAVVSAFAFRRWDGPAGAATKFLAGAGLFLAGGAIQALGLAPHPAFNHNDLFHVIQILGNGMFYLCARDAGGARRGATDASARLT